MAHALDKEGGRGFAIRAQGINKHQFNYLNLNLAHDVHVNPALVCAKG